MVNWGQFDSKWSAEFMILTESEVHYDYFWLFYSKDD